jgi:hypothetical protein
MQQTHCYTTGTITFLCKMQYTHCYTTGTVTLLWKCNMMHRSCYQGKPNMSHYIWNTEKLALDTTEYKPAKWLRYVDDTFIVWPHGPDKLQVFYYHINNLRPSIQFTMERESNNHLPFLDVLVTKNGSTLSTNVYRKPTHTGRYLHFDSNHPHHVKRGVVHSLIHREVLYVRTDKIFLTRLSKLNMIWL